MNKNYLQIANKIVSLPWLITEDGGKLMMDIFERRLNGDKLTDEEIRIRLEEAGAHGEDNSRYTVQDGIATLPIYGPIFGKANIMTELSGATSMEQFRSDFAKAISDNGVHTVLLDIDSPGGTSEMIPEAGNEIFEARGSKPIYAIANSDAGSAAYWLGSQADKLYVTPSGSVGSIGAFTIHKDQSARDAQQGNKYTFIYAGRHKIEGNPHRPISTEAINYRQELIDELYDEFLTTVARGRGTEKETVEANYGEGRMLPAKRALSAGMVDGITEYVPLMHSISEAKPRANWSLKSMKMESVGHEHSEPGTGSPPTPRPNESDRGAYGSRRPDIPENWPNPEQAPGAPKAMGEENKDTPTYAPETIERLMAMVGAETGDQLLAKITELSETAKALQADVTRKQNFAEMFPEEYAQMQRQTEREHKLNAKEFVDSISTFTRQEGDRKVKTKFSLSSLVQEELKELHVKFAKGVASVSDFETVLSHLAHGGVANLGETGSARLDEVEFAPINTTTKQGIREARLEFAERVKTIMRDDKLEYKAAIAEAGRRFPELAEAYQTPMEN